MALSAERTGRVGGQSHAPRLTRPRLCLVARVRVERKAAVLRALSWIGGLLASEPTAPDATSGR
jgi:hypothetical protein